MFGKLPRPPKLPPPPPRAPEFAPGDVVQVKRDGFPYQAVVVAVRGCWVDVELPNGFRVSHYRGYVERP